MLLFFNYCYGKSLADYHPHEVSILPLQTGQTPLMLAVSRGHSGMVDLLLDSGANVNESDNVNIEDFSISLYYLWRISRLIFTLLSTGVAEICSGRIN